MALKKSDLYSSLWKGADELRGGMDASQYKDYVLTLLFVKYVTDKAKSDKNSLIDVPSGGSFDDLVTFKGDKEIGDKINKAISKLAEANDLQKVIDLADFNDEEKLGKGKEMQDRLTNLISIFQDLDFRGSRAEGDDLLGDAYEYLMRHFATESGKSKGQFYTPAEVSRIMAQLIGIKPSTPYSATVYDPTCGSGSLLLKVADAAPSGLTIYGQEKDNATWALAKMNMILHGNEIADIRKGDTISSPQFTGANRLDTFDFLVANPPFSVKSWANGLENEYGRFDGYGRPPEKNGDYAFLLHMLKSLKSTGKGAVILPHGVLFRGNSEATIRKEIIKRGYIKGIIGLPANLFYGTGIPACILVIDKEDAQARTGILMIDAAKGFEKDGAKNRLRARDMHKIVDAFTKQLEIPRYSRMVPLSEIENPGNDYNLNIARYIDSSEPEDVQDLDAHTQGGIPIRDIDALNAYWSAFPSLRHELFRPLRQGYVELAVKKDGVGNSIASSSEYGAFSKSINDLVDEWWSGHREALLTISEMTRPTDLIGNLSESLLDSFRMRPLVDEYAVYEQVMSYWHSTMHDDVALIMGEGWGGAAKPRKTIEDKDRKLSEIPDLVTGYGRSASKYKMDLLPPALIVARYFSDEAAQLAELSAAAETATQSIDEFLEENSGEDSLLADAMVDDKVTKALASARLRDAKREDPSSEEVKALVILSGLYDAESAAKRAAKDAATRLDGLILANYDRLSIAEVQQLVIDDKWSTTVKSRIRQVVVGLIQRMIARVSELGDRYGSTLDEIQARVSSIGEEVSRHMMDLNVPDASVRVQVGELGTTYGGLTGKTKADFGHGGGRFVTFVEVISGPRLKGLSLESVELRAGERQNEVRRGDLLFNGSSETANEIALAAVVDFDPVPATFLNSFCFGFRLRRGAPADPTYLAYYFRSAAGRGLVSSLAQGAIRYNIAKRKFKELKIDLPPLAEQQRIAQQLRDAEDAYLELARLEKKRRQIAEGVTQTLLGDGRQLQSPGVAA